MEKVKDSVTARKSKTSKKRAPKLNKRVSNPVEENANKNGTDSAAQPRHILADSSLPDKSSVGESKPKVKHRVIFDKEAPPPPPPPCLPFDSAGTLIVPFLKSTPEKRNAAMFSDIWLSISNIFCFTSSNYVSDDDYILYTGSMDDDNDVPTVRGAKDPSRRKNSMKKKSKSFILESMKVFDWSEDTPVPEQNPKNLLFFSRSGDYSNNKDLLGLDLNEEGQRILSIFTGVTRVSGVVLNWNLKASKKDVNIHTCDIHNSPWQAIKSDCIIQQDKKKILDLLLDDTRSCEYDEAMEGYEDMGTLGDHVRVRRYFYTAIWPTSARDFILCSTWKELQDGSILVSTISPPDDTFPHVDGYVRACVLISGVLIRPIDPRSGGGCAVTLIGHSDLKGSLPSTIVNMLSVGLPMKLMTKMKTILEKKT